jgi:DNA modification methylase
VIYRKDDIPADLQCYFVRAEMGLEPTPDEFIAGMVDVFRKVRRVLRDDATLWLNIGDSYANDGKWGGHTGGKHAAALHCSPIGRNKKYTGLKPKDLIGIPWMLAFALRADGWHLRQDIIWSKPNPMPESVRDRCTKAHEYLFLLSKSGRYYYDGHAIMEALTTAPGENYPARARVTGRANQGSAAARGNDRDKSGGFPPRKLGLPPRHAGYPETSDQSGLDSVSRGEGRNKRSVWTVATQPFKEAHFATFPPALIEPCILAGSPKGGMVLDPFGGAGTTGLVADRLQRDATLIELNPEYVEIAKRRIAGDQGPMFSAVEAA